MLRGPVLLSVVAVVSVCIAPVVARADEPPAELLGFSSERRLDVELEASFEPEERAQLLLACERALRGGRCALELSGSIAPLVGRVSRIDGERVRLFVGRDEASAQVVELSFATEDSPSERARAIGLSLGSLGASFFEAEAARGAAPGSPLPEESPPLAAQLEARGEPAAHDASPAPPAARALVLAELGLGADPGLPRAELQFGALLRVAPLAAPIFPRLALHGSTSLAESDRETLVRVAPTLGVGTHVLLPFVEIDLGTDVGVEWLEASRGSSAATRVTPYWAIAATGLFDLSRRWGLSCGARVATVFSPTDVFVDGVRTASSTAIVGAVFLGVFHRVGDE